MKFLSSKTIATALLATGVAVGGMIAPASAKGNPNAGGGDSEVTLECNLLDITGAKDCKGPFDLNDSQGDEWSIQLNDNDVFGNYQWYEADKIDVVKGDDMLSSDFFKIFYDKDSDAEQWSVGTIEFLKDIDFQFAMSLKTSTSWNLYSFDGVTAGTTMRFDTFNVARTGPNNSGNSGKELSHSTLYISNNKITPDTPEPQEVPEPTLVGGLLMLGAGLATSRRRRVK